MKKVWQILAVAVVALVPLAASDSALAAEGWTCREGFKLTGPESHNVCVSTDEFECTIANENKIEVKNDNLQFAESGDVKNSGNTNGDGSWSGEATNSNGTAFDVVIENGGCVVKKVTVPAIPPAAKPPVKAPTKQVPQPGQGAVTPVVMPQEEQAPTVLPNTSGDSVMPYLAAMVGALGVGTAVSRLAVAAYGRFKS